MTAEPHPSAEREVPRQTEPVVELRGISKFYGSTQALADVNLHVQPHEVVGLVGDNGSGKSTLLKIITGYHAPSSGEIRFAGVPVRLRSPADARNAGIECVYQDLALLDELSLWRNFFLGREEILHLGPFGLMRARRMRRTCAEALDRLELVHVRSTDEPATALSGGEKQSLAITRAIHFGARLLLLDEPTAALSVRETRNVLTVIDQARERGLGVVYIDHNIDHVIPVADRVVLLEHGRIAGEYARGHKSADEIRELVARRTRVPDLARRHS